MNINKNAKRILIFGDSYTFGKIPAGDRYDNESRYTGLLQKKLGDGYEIIEEGLRGRMIEGENAFFPFRNGFEQFGPILGSHLPIDLLILFMGTNDANSGSHKTPQEIVQGYDYYLGVVKWWVEHLDFPQPKILIIAPPIINELESYKIFKELFKGAQDKVEKLVQLLRAYADKNNLEFFDSSAIITTSNIDGIHLDEEANELLAEALSTKIKECRLD